tara:strand:+ start:1146 stop:1394 length:249 start_codon:yes stop_codon:yes gene_type:complete
MKVTKTHFRQIISEEIQKLNEVSVYKKPDGRGVKNALDALIKPLLMQVRFSKAHKNSEVDSVIEDILDDFKDKLRRNTGIRL